MEQPWIVSDEATAALTWAAAAPDQDAFRLGAALTSRFGLSAEQRATVLTQLDLRTRAAKRWGVDTSHLWLTRDGLEQATRPAVAAWRARRLSEFGVRRIADLGCGLGFESRAFAAAGMHVTGVELDPDVAALAVHNLANADAHILIGDVTEPATLDQALNDVDAVFLDPARRDVDAPRTIDGLTGHRVSDPEQWSPPWSWVEQLAQQHPRTVVKVAPGFPHALIPPGGSAVWAAADGDLVEASIWFDGFAGMPQRSALSIAFGTHAMLDSDMPVCDDVRAVDAHLLDVAPVVTRSGLVTTLAASIGASRIDEHIGYLTCANTPAPSTFHTAYRVLDVMPFDRKRIGQALVALGTGALTVTKRGFAADTEQLRAHWLKRCIGNRAVTVALTRIGDAPTAIICER